MNYFKIEEFACKCCGKALMDEGFLHDLDWLRGEFGGPLIITSGYRCPSHNQKVSTTGPNGPHTTGRAADIGIRGKDALELLDLILTSNRFTGVGLNQKGTSRFIHVDNLPNGPGCPRPTVWTY